MRNKSTQLNRQAESGAIMAEFAFVLPILIVLLFGIIQFGLTLNRAQTFNSAAREGARVASLSDSTQGEISTAANDALAGMTLGIVPTIGVTPNSNQPCQGRAGQTVTVVVSSPYTISVPLLPDYNITLTGTGVFRCE